MSNCENVKLEFKSEVQSDDFNYESRNKRKYMIVSIVLLIVMASVLFLGVNYFKENSYLITGENISIYQFSSLVENGRTAQEILKISNKIKDTQDVERLTDIINSEILDNIVILFNNIEYNLKGITEDNSDEVIINYIKSDEPSNPRKLINISVEDIKGMTPDDIALDIVLGMIMVDFREKHPDLEVKSIGNPPDSKSFVGLYSEKGGKLVSSYRAQIKDNKIIFSEVKRGTK